jgi:glucans biosynthesis protein C
MFGKKNRMYLAKQLPSSSFNPARFHGLDAARAIALLIGVFHHGIESFISYAKWDWITQDSQSNLLLDILFYVSHVFRMQAFFLMAGFFAHLLLSKKGYWGFVLNRGKRLVLPFFLFWPVLYASIYYLWVWGIQYVKHCSYLQAVAQLPDYMVFSKGFPLVHLWFLYFLILFCAGVMISVPIIRRIDAQEKLRKGIDRFLSFTMRRWWGSLLIGLPMVIPMLGMRDWFGVDTSASGLMPKIAPFFLYGMYFTLGWFLYRQITLLQNIEKFRTSNLVLGISLIVLLIVLNLLLADPTPSSAGIILAILNTLYAFASITTAFAFIGYMMAHFSKPSATIRHLSDASYWGYLIHLPIVGFFQIIVAPYGLFWPLKLALIFAPSLVILMMSYSYGVQNTILGVLLNGKKRKGKEEMVLALNPNKDG